MTVNFILCRKRGDKHKTLCDSKRSDREMVSHKVHKCEYRRYTAKDMAHLMEHTRRHTGERPFRCASPCNRAFVTVCYAVTL